MKKIIKENQWILLPTKDKSIIYILSLSDKSNSIHIGEYAYCEPEDEARTNQHLYLLSKEEIKIGDWFCDGDGEICKYTSDYVVNPNDWEDNEKIIATTNKSLVIKITGNPIKSAVIVNVVPQIQESFARHFVEKQGRVGDIEVEYNKFHNKLEGHGTVFELKLTPKGEIEIVFDVVEKIRNTEEVKALLIKLHDDLADTLTSGFVSLDKWIEENL